LLIGEIINIIQLVQAQGLSYYLWIAIEVMCSDVIEPNRIKNILKIDRDDAR
jgi:hypothetical protein